MNYEIPSNVDVIIGHPFGDIQATLEEWIETGPPSERPLVAPIKAINRDNGEELPLTIIPFPYRNSLNSIIAIVNEEIPDPWNRDVKKIQSMMKQIGRPVGKRNVLVIGSGGREHALVWKLSQSPLVEKIFVAPGNAGTAAIAENVPISVDELEVLVSFAQINFIGLTVVGPEVPLAEGIVDLFQASGMAIFGPTQAAAQLESSKAFAKAFMAEQNVPTAKAAVFTEYASAKKALPDFVNADGVVIKASGLAAGKGVIVCDSLAEAEAALQEIMEDKSFGGAGDEVLIEERMSGPELSLMILSDGKTAVSLLPSRDHKRAFDNDEGLNTGGMGAFGPPLDVEQAMLDEIMTTIVNPTIQGMAANGMPYVGALYPGIMLTPDGPKVVEFNSRFGDPETQVVLPMLDGDLAEIMLACVNGRLDASFVKQYEGACATVVMASPGYPGSYPKGLPITGLDAVPDDVLVFHAGTKEEGGKIVTSGGRVLAVSARGEDLETAVAKAYAGVATIKFENAHYRTDIGRGN